MVVFVSAAMIQPRVLEQEELRPLYMDFQATTPMVRDLKELWDTQPWM